jgi:hypothetical protein
MIPLVRIVDTNDIVVGMMHSKVLIIFDPIILMIRIYQ